MKTNFLKIIGVGIIFFWKNDCILASEEPRPSNLIRDEILNCEGMPDEDMLEVDTNDPELQVPALEQGLKWLVFLEMAFESARYTCIELERGCNVGWQYINWAEVANAVALWRDACGGMHKCLNSLCSDPLFQEIENPSGITIDNYLEAFKNYCDQEHLNDRIVFDYALSPSLEDVWSDILALEKTRARVRGLKNLFNFFSTILEKLQLSVDLGSLIDLGEEALWNLFNRVFDEFKNHFQESENKINQEEDEAVKNLEKSYLECARKWAFKAITQLAGDFKKEGWIATNTDTSFASYIK
jgi:hypothetical protein